MKRTDARGLAVSGAATAALEAWERALAAALGWRTGAEAELDRALAESPRFVMAHAMQGWLLASGRDPERVRAARPVHARALALASNRRERHHLAALGAMLDDDYPLARRRLGALLRAWPRDALALQVAHALDHVVGDVWSLRSRVEAVLPAWSRAMPGHHAVVAMHAFGLVETRATDRAHARALEALEGHTADARAHHVIAHVHEMADRPEAGERWLRAHADAWSVETLVATHAWWHLALFELAQGRGNDALATYDARIRRAPGDASIADLIDGSALLWRLQLAGVDPGARWRELAEGWAPHVEDRFCTFSDLHAMLAFVGAGDVARATRLERVLADAQADRTRHGGTTRAIGLRAGRALMAFGRGAHALAVRGLASLPGLASPIGGSHAQRDVLTLTLLQAVQRIRRPGRASLRGAS